MMQANRNLIAAARKQLEGDSFKHRRDAIEETIGMYEVACVLSRGPSPDRSNHWEMRAREFEEELRRFVPWAPLMDRKLPQ